MWPMFLSFSKRWYLFNFLWVTGKPLLLVHEFFLKGWVIYTYEVSDLSKNALKICLSCIIFIPYVSLSPPYSNLYWLSHCKFGIQPQGTYQFQETYICLIKHFHNHINLIHLSGSFYLLHHLLFFCSIFFSPVQFMIECVYQIFCDLSLIGNMEVCHSICILHIDHKLLYFMKIIVAYNGISCITHTYYLYSRLNW